MMSPAASQPAPKQAYAFFTEHLSAQPNVLFMITLGKTIVKAAIQCAILGTSGGFQGKKGVEKTRVSYYNGGARICVIKE